MAKINTTELAGDNVAAFHLSPASPNRRGETIACLCKGDDATEYFRPLQRLGYELTYETSGDDGALAKINVELDESICHGIAVFNPYMRSHSIFLPLFEKAKGMGRPVFAVERGALPGTLSYDVDVCLNSPGFSEASFLAQSFSREELEWSAAFIDELRRGEKSLEEMAAYPVTAAKYDRLDRDPRIKCFIPLQRLPQKDVSDFSQL